MLASSSQHRARHTPTTPPSAGAMSPQPPPPYNGDKRSGEPDMTTAPTCIIAYTADDDRYKHVRDAGIEAAANAEARLILYDIDAAQLLAAPLPTAWSGEGARDEFPNRLLPDDL